MLFHLAWLVAESAAGLRERLDNHAQLQRDLVSLRARAVKEVQINRLVELNLEIKRLEAELAATNATLAKEEAQ